MPAHTRLYRRGATYYHRAAIPIDIKASYSKTEETFSLGTKDYQEALKRVRVEAARVDGLFEEHRRSLAHPALEDLTADQVKHIETVYYAHLLDEDDDVRLAEFDGWNLEGYAQDIEESDEEVRYLYARGAPGAFFEDEAEEVLSWDNVELRVAPNSLAKRKTVRALHQAWVRAAQVKKLRNKGEPVDTPPFPPSLEASNPSSSPISQPTPKGGPKLSVLVEEWAEEKARTSWAPKTEQEHRVWIRHFITLVGDRPLATFGREDGRAFKKLLMELPANWNKQKPLIGLTVDKAASQAKAFGLTPMSDKNVNKLIGYVGSFWTWAEKHYDDCPNNPLKGLKVPMGKRNVRDERDSFSIEDLNTIFAAPLYTGCKSRSSWAESGNLIADELGIFWAPLVGLFTGARAGEIIQLYAEDVREEKGVAFIDINGDGEDKRLKTPHSRRRIPIHQTLMDLGFMRHVEMRRTQAEKRLFPEMQMGRDGYYSSPFSKHFSRFLVKAGIKTETNSFHSFRHTFEDACRDSRISKDVMDALQGHSERGMSGRYGRGFALETLAEEMSKLSYLGLDLSRLKKRGTAAERS